MICSLVRVIHDSHIGHHPSNQGKRERTLLRTLLVTLDASHPHDNVDGLPPI